MPRHNNPRGRGASFEPLTQGHSAASARVQCYALRRGFGRAGWVRSAPLYQNPSLFRIYSTFGAPNHFFKLPPCNSPTPVVCLEMMMKTSAPHTVGVTWSWWWRSAIAQGKGTA